MTISTGSADGYGWVSSPKKENFSIFDTHKIAGVSERIFKNVTIYCKFTVKRHLKSMQCDATANDIRLSVSELLCLDEHVYIPPLAFNI